MDVDSIFRRQHGLITRSQARAAGLSARQIETRTRSGAWVRTHRGVYRHAAVADSWEAHLLSGCLTSCGLASHRAGTVVWGLGVYRHPRPEIVVDRSARRRVPGVIVHESTQWELRDETVIRGIPVTGINRTLLDCGAVVTMRRLERLTESAIRQRLTTWPELVRTLSRHSRKGRDGCGKLRTLLEMRLGDQTVPLSDFSRLVSNLLVDNGLPEPVLEHRILAADGSFIMQADLAWPLRRKAWELDGLAFHFGRTERERDNRKRNRAKAEGWNIQEILWSMYVDDPGGLVALCRRFLRLVTPSRGAKPHLRWFSAAISLG